jgi:Cd(II)/Pb(II)-responsive transcriptional regulator
MKIGDLAVAAQCSVETIRYYEKQRLLPAAERSGNNYRLYGPRHLERLLFIRNCRALDMSQKEVNSLLGLMDQSSADCDSVNLVLDEHISHVDRRIEELRGLKGQLQELRKKCRRTTRVKDCQILKGISDMPPKARSSASHL